MSLSPDQSRPPEPGSVDAVAESFRHYHDTLPQSLMTDLERQQDAEIMELLDFVRKTRLWVSARGPMRQTTKDHLVEWADRLLPSAGEEP